jgi:hypothetical protein
MSADLRLWAAVFLARDLTACRALLLGVDVPRHRLHPGALALLDEPADGPPIQLTGELALRCELSTQSPTDQGWKRRTIGRRRR